jgi:hypothetical protein
MFEKVVEKGEEYPWLLVALFAAFMGFISVVWIALLPTAGAIWHFYNLGIVLCPSQITSAPFILILLWLGISKLKSFGRFTNIRKLVLLYTAALSISFFTDYAAILEWYGEIWAHRWLSPAVSENLIPTIMAPPENIARQLLTGGVPIPWADWAVPLLWWWLLMVSYGLLMVSIATVMRRGWIEVEKVPFPHTTAAYLIADMGLKPQRQGIKRIFLIGVALGIIFQLPIWAQAMFPWFPDVYGWRELTCGHGGYQVQANSALGSLLGLSVIAKHPLNVAIAYFAPLSIQFSVWFFYVIYLIAVQVAFFMGYYTGLESTNGCGRGGFCSDVTPQAQPPFKFGSLAYVGGTIALTSIYLVMNRGYFVDTFKVALRNIPSEKIVDLEKNEPLTYRMLYTLVLIFLLTSIAVLMIAGVSFPVALLMPITVFFVWVANARAYGLAGYTMQFLPGNFLYRFAIWPTAPEPVTSEYVVTISMAFYMTDVPKAFGGATLSSFASYKMANLFGVNSRDIFKTLILALVIGPLFVILGFIWINYTYGLNRLSFSAALWNSVDGWTDPSFYAAKPASEPWIQYVVAGFIIAAVLYVLHSKFIWFPLDPIGFVLGTSWTSTLWGIWFPFLIAWILKVLTLRIGGSRAYEEYGIPLMTGFIAGYMIAVLVGGLAGIIQFFKPY